MGTEQQLDFSPTLFAALPSCAQRHSLHTLSFPNPSQGRNGIKFRKKKVKGEEEGGDEEVKEGG